MSKFLDDLQKFCEENTQNLYRVAVIECDGDVEYIKLNSGNPCQDSYSVAKAFVVAAIGMLYDDGKLAVTDKVTEILKEETPEEVDPRWHNITVEDAIRITAENARRLFQI